jgi:hypothetical protein
MGPIFAALLLNSHRDVRQDPKNPSPVQIANRRFRDFVGAQKSLAVHMTFHRKDVPVDGKADLILLSPDKLYYHFVWGRDEYTYAVSGGRATEVDRGGRLYDEYPVPYAGAPEASGSPWVGAFFPSAFIDPNVTLPAKAIDAGGKITHYTVNVGNPAVAVNISFSDYKTGVVVPDSKFQVSPPAGFVAYSTQRVPATLPIGQKLPNVQLSSAGTKSSTKLVDALNGKPTLVAVFGPDSDPGRASLPALVELGSTRVVILNLAATGEGIEGGTIPIFYDPQGKLAGALRAYRSPTFYLVDGSGTITNTWYGFAKSKQDLFISQVKQAVSEQ